MYIFIICMQSKSITNVSTIYGINKSQQNYHSENAVEVMNGTTFWNSMHLKKILELLARMKQLTLAYDNKLTELNGYRVQIKRAIMKQGGISSFFHQKVN